MTEAEYLEIERHAEFKSEYFDGEMFAMAGGTPMHSLIAANLIREFGNQLKGRPCRPFTSDLRLKIETAGLFTYADMAVVCGSLQHATGDEETVVNPTLVAEVLSDSTEAYDRGIKFRNYIQVPTLQEYLLVSQREPRVEHFVRQASGPWLWREVSGLEASLEIPSLQITVALAEIFAGVEFSPASMRPQVQRTV
jgi:Uma2 family endonuclease